MFTSVAPPRRDHRRRTGIGYTGRSSLAPCIVVGLQQNGLGVARALGRQGVPVIGVSDNLRDVHCATRYARMVQCPDLRGEGLIDTLEKIGRSIGSGVLILTLDRSVLLVSEHRARLEPWLKHSLPDDQVIKCLMNKAEIARFAQAHDFKVPRTFAIRSEEDLEECLNTIQLPGVLKPQIKTVTFVERSPKKAFFIRTLDELRLTWHKVVQWEPEVVVQEWISGPETGLIFCLYYFDDSGRAVASFTGRKLRQYIPYCGTACAAEPWNDQVALEAGIRFFQAAGYRGFGAIEFKIDSHGEYYLIEPTVGRTEHIFALAAANGINLPYAGYCDTAGLPMPELRRSRRSVIYVDWKRDLRAARFLVDQGELTWLDWLKSVSRPTQHALFVWDDPAPLAREITGRVVTKVGRMATRIGPALKHRLDLWRDPSGIRNVDLGAATTPRPARDLSAHLDAALDWLCAAHDAGNGGVARGYAFSSRSGYPVGWQAAYPETTGYIIPTLFDCASLLGRSDLADRAQRMAEWELGLQHESGGFPGGTVALRSAPPVVFNTGMVLLGLTRAQAETGRVAYRDAIARAAEFLVRTQSRDGGWRRFVSLEGESRIHAYDCLVNVALMAAAKLLGEHRWASAASRNLDFTLTLQAPNGWLGSNALSASRNHIPLTHTIAYSTAGFLEAGLMLGVPRFVDAAERTAAALMNRIRRDGFLAGEFDADWRPAAQWSCLTGTAQMAILWQRLFELRGDTRYADAAQRAMSYLMSRHEIERGHAGIRGGVAGSFPVNARYGRFQFLNWSAKFFVDLLVLAQRAQTHPATILQMAERQPEAPGAPQVEVE